MSKAYGFEYICFWQPVIYTKNILTEEEHKFEDRVLGQQLKKLYLDTYEAIKKQPRVNFHNLSGVLDRHAGTLYSDFCHLSEEGNEIVANEIFKAISSELTKEQ